MACSSPACFILRHPAIFIGRMLRQFQANRGLLLAAAIAYYALLALVPLVILLLVALSQVINEAQLLDLLRRYLEQLVPGESDLILNQVIQFLGQRRALGWTMVGTLLFFSATAFGVLENAMMAIFTHRHAAHRRNWIISLLLPYLAVLLLGFGLLTMTLLIGLVQNLIAGEVQWFGWQWSLGHLQTLALYFVGLLSQIGALTLVYHTNYLYILLLYSGQDKIITR